MFSGYVWVWGLGGVGASDYVLVPPDVSILTQVFFVENCLAKDGQ